MLIHLFFTLQTRMARRTWLIMSCLLFSCIPDPLEVENIPAIKPQIVVASQIVPDRSLVVLLTRTITALEASDDSDPEDLISQIAVNDALVTLIGPSGIPDTLLFLDNGLYGGVTFVFAPGDEYTLNVRSPSMGEVQATTVVQESVPFEEIDAALYYNGFNDTLAQITYSIIDPEAPNWYMINVQEVESEDVVENIINPRAFTRLMDDATFSGDTFSEQFRVFPRDYRPGDTIAVSLSSISAEYYAFMKVRIDNRFSLVEFLGEPLNYPSNVMGGKGFFNLYIPDVRFFVFD